MKGKLLFITGFILLLGGCASEDALAGHFLEAPASAANTLLPEGVEATEDVSEELYADQAEDEESSFPLEDENEEAPNKRPEAYVADWNQRGEEYIESVWLAEDVDGDGESEEIEIRFYGEWDAYSDGSPYIYSWIMKINGEVAGEDPESFSMIDGKAAIIDLDEGDGMKEIAILTAVDPYEYLEIWRWENDSLQFLGRVRGSLESHDEYSPELRLLGDGRFYGPESWDILHTFDCYVPYEVSAETGRIERLEAGFYQYCRSNKALVLQDFQAYKDKNLHSERQNMEAGKCFWFTGTDGERWLAYMDEQGETGWILADESGFKLAGYGYGEDYLAGINFYG